MPVPSGSQPMDFEPADNLPRIGAGCDGRVRIRRG